MSSGTNCPGRLPNALVVIEEVETRARAAVWLEDTKSYKSDLVTAVEGIYLQLVYKK